MVHFLHVFYKGEGAMFTGESESRVSGVNILVAIKNKGEAFWSDAAGVLYGYTER